MPVLTVDGRLDSTTYLTLRDRIIKAALAEPPAVIIDVTALEVPATSAWAVFTSARWHVSTWPDVPIVLVCAHAAGRKAISRSGTTRYVPVYPTVEAAWHGVHAGPGGRRRAHARLPATMASLSESRRMVREMLATWSQSALIPTATVIVNALVENVLQHTQSAPGLRLETDGATVTVAVEDDSSAVAHRRERGDGGADTVSGLAIVAALSRAWGSTPIPSGKTVWAVIGPENRL
jgi:anti-anti-sigma regulatory factor